VTSGPVRFRSSNRRSGSYRKRVTRRGTYRIICTIHGSSQRMTLRVR
jgi:mRNA-degrading endonuclease RelE of RelBE toxin-antitoxin system